MKILIVLTYYAPYTSGLTVYAVRQARALAAMGHQVTVLTSQHERTLPVEENLEGVQVIRVPVALRVSKGVIMPQMPLQAWRLMRSADVVNLHVPQMDAALMALLARWRKKPVVLTYHCDLQMPPGWVSQLAGFGAKLVHHLSARLAQAIVQNTWDYAEHSNFLRRYLDKTTVIRPPIINESVSDGEVQAFREKYGIQRGERVIGMVARLAEEKGVEYLVEALPEIQQKEPKARVVFVGAYENVLGESAYREKILPMIGALGDQWIFLGILSEKEKAAFYHVCDVLVLPSVNSTESFGMVQVEALICGTPVVVSDLPGVRQLVREKGMGEIVPVRDSAALAKAIINVLKRDMRLDPAMACNIAQQYTPETVAEAYADLYRQVKEDHG
ncbi:MAG: glycosyltransferase family 4 protein [Brevefilum sp.]|nr:glycosyltransferase family 4 protein [Brevefilum sp.]